LNKSKAYDAASAAPLIDLAYFLSAIIGGTGPDKSGTPF